MDGTVRTALIAAAGVIASAGLSSVTTIWVSSNDLRAKTQEVESLNKQARSNLQNTSNLLRYVYDNGSLSNTSLTGGKMVVRVNGSHSAGPVSDPIDMNRFVELCGDEDGCSLTLGATRFRPEAYPNYVINPPLQGASCRFFWDKTTHSWTLSQQCVATYGLYSYNKSSTKYEFNQAYQIYEYSNTFGIDDSAGAKDPDGQPLIIIGFKGACYLAESAPDIQQGQGKLLPDDPSQPGTGKGLYLIASSPTWDYPGAYPHDGHGKDTVWPSDDSLRGCELIVED